ncbi:MAG TPA: DUF721 domain-containing protein [Acidobacteriaceae bacterium]|jgi:hypothetical protein
MQGMRDLLRDSLGCSLRELNEVDRLAAAWPVACGSALAAHGEIEALDGERVLRVRITGAEWMQPFRSMRTALQNDLSRIAAVPLSGIHFDVKSYVPPPRPDSSTGVPREAPPSRKPAPSRRRYR